MTGGTRQGWTVVVPFKDPGVAKSRLQGLVDGVRRRLAVAMMRDVVSTVAAVPAVDRVRLVSPASDRGRGLNRELTAAAVGPGSRVAMLPADLACITGVDVAELLQRADEVAVGAVPDHTTRGTVALTFRSVDVFAEFGRLSSPAARRLGHRPRSSQAASRCRPARRPPARQERGDRSLHGPSPHEYRYPCHGTE